MYERCFQALSEWLGQTAQELSILFLQYWHELVAAAICVIVWFFFCKIKKREKKHG